jgi:hypothetical protein
MEPLERLAAIEAIKQLKARYFYGYDHKDWAFWRDQVWAPEGRLEIPEIDFVVEPRDTMIAWVAEQAADQVSVHHGHTPIIEITSPTTAKGIWAMEDRLYRSKEHPMYDGSIRVLGFGHYHESYVKLDVGWRILSTRLTRIRTVWEKVF